jgi:AcrR family transcriptional regulator
MAPEATDAASAALLDATSALLAEHGARHWSVEDVAERAGLGRATVYRRFSSRDDLMKAAVTRDVRRFFAAVADSVQGLESLEDKVVHGFLHGVGLALASPLGSMLRRDPAASMSLLGSESLLRAATQSLTDRYEAMLGHALPAAARADAEVSAEALVRLGLSFVLIPGMTAETGRRSEALSRLGAIIRPLLSPPA